MLVDYSCEGTLAAENKTVALIQMFSQALRQYKKLPVRTAEEANLLRIMIYCFKGYSNKRNCALGDAKDYPEDAQRLLRSLKQRVPPI